MEELLLYISFPNTCLTTLDSTQLAEVCTSTLHEESNNIQLGAVAKTFLHPRVKLHSLLLLFSKKLFFGLFEIAKLNPICSLMLQAFFVANVMYQLVSRHCALRMTNDTRSAQLSVSSLVKLESSDKFAIVHFLLTKVILSLHGIWTFVEPIP